MSFQEAASPLPQHDETYKRGVWACGQRRDHQVRIHRAHWPPRLLPGFGDKAFVSAQCQRCDAHVIVSDPPPPDVTVILYGDASEAQGRVVDEVGQVIEEAPATAGKVVDEAPAAPRGKR